MAPLERRSGQALVGQGRSDCIRAFEENPEGFRSCAARALRKGKSPLGLLVKMVQQGQHRIPAAATVCPSCETGGGRHVNGCPEARAA